MGEQLAQGVRERFARAARTKARAAESLEAGREYVEAYVGYIPCFGEARLAVTVGDAAKAAARQANTPSVMRIGSAVLFTRLRHSQMTALVFIERARDFEMTRSHFIDTAPSISNHALSIRNDKMQITACVF
jgi:hypothetical protein